MLADYCEVADVGSFLLMLLDSGLMSSDEFA
jgi:hypothetical protein